MAGPISKGDLHHNLCQAVNVSRVLIRLGYAVFTPQLSMFMGADHKYQRYGNDYTYTAHADPTAQMNEGISHGEWLDMDFAWIEVSDCLLRLPGESKGADLEVDWAEKIRKPVFSSVAELREFFEGGFYRGQPIPEQRPEVIDPAPVGFDHLDEFCPPPGSSE